MAANCRWCVNVCVNGWMRGKNCKALWIKALYKCSPFTIYHSSPTTEKLSHDVYTLSKRWQCVYHAVLSVDHFFVHGSWLSTELYFHHWPQPHVKLSVFHLLASLTEWSYSASLHPQLCLSQWTLLHHFLHWPHITTTLDGWLVYGNTHPENNAGLSDEGLLYYCFMKAVLYADIAENLRGRCWTVRLCTKRRSIRELGLILQRNGELITFSEKWENHFQFQQYGGW